MIDANASCATFRDNEACVFAIFMKNLECQAAIEAGQETHLRTIVQANYLSFLDVFFKKDSETVFPHQ